MLRKSFSLTLVGALSLALTGAVSAQAPSPFRVSASQKGSLLIFSKIEIKWDQAGNVIQDTFLDISNDTPFGDVRVQGYFINGDTEIEEDCTGSPCTTIIQEYEPGWNTADCQFTLTPDQPSFWSAAQGFVGAAANGGFRCQAFTELDRDDINGHGRPDPENMNNRILRGYMILWAERFVPFAQLPPDVAQQYPDGVFWPINWNHLKGDGLIVNYENGTAWEYNAWAFQARTGIQGELIGLPGRLNMDGIMYDWPFSSLLLDFYGTGSTALSGGNQTVMVDTDLTVHAVTADVRQDGCGPVLTKVEASIWNEFETKFSGTRRCICCWDQTMLSNWVRSAAIPNHFKRSALRTDKGKARLDGLASTECDYYDLCGPTAMTKRLSNCVGGVAGPGFLHLSDDAAILGLATKFLAFSSGDKATAGMNLVGMGEQAAFIGYDPTTGSPALLAPDRGAVRTIGDRSSKGLTSERGTTSR
jgi:hypothetical protein